MSSIGSRSPTASFGPLSRSSASRYYPEDHAPYDHEHWTPLLDAIEWLRYHVALEIAEGMVIAWVCIGRLPYATWVFDLQRGKAAIEPWGGPPPSGLVLLQQIQEARQRS